MIGSRGAIVVVVVVVAAGCGRIWFDPQTDARVGDALPPDAADPDLVAYYPFDTFANASTPDVIIGNDGTCNPACPAPDAGHLGGGLRFDGTASCLEVLDRGQLALPSVTLSAWSRVDVVASNQTQLSKRFDNVGPLNTWQLELTGGPPTDQSFTTFHGNAFNEYTQSTLRLPEAGVWQHIVGTFDGAMLRLYVDGVLIASTAMSQPLVYDANPLRIGCDDNDGLVSFFGGVLDEVRIYRRALSAEEIAAIP